jgi:hypothetical protein
MEPFLDLQRLSSAVTPRCAVYLFLWPRRVVRGAHEGYEVESDSDIGCGKSIGLVAQGEFDARMTRKLKM